MKETKFMDIGTKKVNIEISTNTIIKVLIVLFLIWILYLIRDVVAILFFTIILVSILEPAVNWLRLKKVPKTLSVIIVYLCLVAIFALVILLIIPPITEQADQLSQNFPQYWEKITKDFSKLGDFLDKYGITQSLENSLANLKLQLPDSLGVFSKLGDFISGLFSLFVILVISFYILVQDSAIKRILRSLLPGKSMPYATQLVNRIQKKLGLWLRGQLILGFLIFLLVYVGLILLGVKYALILAIIAGLLEFIPYLGPMIAGFLAIMLTLFHSPVLALLVLVLYMVIQAIENHILVPKVMQKTVGLNPVISIFALLIGAKLGGVIGLILAIPVVTALSVFIQDFFDKKKEEELRIED